MEAGAISTAVRAFMNAKQSVQDSAQEIALSSINGSPSDMISPLIELKVAEQQAMAAAKIISAENNRIGSLLDILA